MKRTFFLLVAVVVSTTIAHAQAGKVMAAYNYLESYKTSHAGEDLIEAKAAIDAACKEETTSILGKTWYYKGLIYHSLALDSLMSKTNASYLQDALESYTKSVTMDDKKFKNSRDALQGIKSISADIFNGGVDAYQSGDYKTAYAKFNQMNDINKTLESNNFEVVIPTAQCKSHAALSALQGGLNKEAIAGFEELNKTQESADNYRYLSMLYNKEGDKTKALNTLETASEKYPDNADIIIDQLNLYIEDGKLNEAIDKIDKAITLQPDNDMLYFVKGNAYDKNGDMEKAIIEYEKAIEINPKNDKALYNAGAMYFLGANKYIEQINALSYKELDTPKHKELEAQRKEMYVKAKPYFEKVLEIIPDDEGSKKALYKINSILEK